MISDDQIKQDEAMCKAATPGPWVWEDWSEGRVVGTLWLVAPPETRPDGQRDVYPDLGNCILILDDDGWNEEDKKYIASARTALPDYIEEVKALRAENERLQLIAKGKLQEASELSLEHVEWNPGRLDFTGRAPIVQVIAAHLAREFVEAGGVNYVEFALQTDKLGELVLTMQRADGKTPGIVNTELRSENADLRARVAELEKVLEAAEVFVPLMKAWGKTVGLDDRVGWFETGYMPTPEELDRASAALAALRGEGKDD